MIPVAANASLRRHATSPISWIRKPTVECAPRHNNTINDFPESLLQCRRRLSYFSLILKPICYYERRNYLSCHEACTSGLPQIPPYCIMDCFSRFRDFGMPRAGRHGDNAPRVCRRVVRLLSRRERSYQAYADTLLCPSRTFCIGSPAANQWSGGKMRPFSPVSTLLLS